MWKVRVQTPFGEGPITFYAEEVDFNHMPLVCIGGIRESPMHGAIILPTNKRVSELTCLDPLYVPYTSLVYAGQVTDPGEILRFERKLVLKQAMNTKNNKEVDEDEF